MIAAAIDLLAEHTVDDVANAAVAVASGTQPSYVTRYFGSRDLFLLAVADELDRAAPDGASGWGCWFTDPPSGIADLAPRRLRGGGVVQALALPGRRDLPGPGREGPAAHRLGRQSRAGAGLAPWDRHAWATIALLSFVGYRLLDDILGISPEDAGVMGDTIVRGIRGTPRRRPPPGPPSRRTLRRPTPLTLVRLTDPVDG